MLSIGAALVHAAVVREHLAEWWVYGAFFIVVTAYQMGFGLTQLRAPSRTWLRSGIAINLGITAIWAISRTDGIPFGPFAHQPEAVGTPDLICVALQIGLIVAAMASLRPNSPPVDRPALATTLTLATSSFVVAVLATAGIVAAQPDQAAHMQTVMHMAGN